MDADGIHLVSAAAENLGLVAGWRGQIEGPQDSKAGGEHRCCARRGLSFVEPGRISMIPRRPRCWPAQVLTLGGLIDGRLTMALARSTTHNYGSASSSVPGTLSSSFRTITTTSVAVEIDLIHPPSDPSRLMIELLPNKHPQYCELDPEVCFAQAFRL